MDEDANSVNINKKPYHHGDLRAALIAEGLRLLAQRDAESLSLRELARGIGVSATSVYRHFPDKKALMTALALEGLARLGAAQQRQRTRRAVARQASRRRGAPMSASPWPTPPCSA